jgi:hypothetical protein
MYREAATALTAASTRRMLTALILPYRDRPAGVSSPGHVNFPPACRDDNVMRQLAVTAGLLAVAAAGCATPGAVPAPASTVQDARTSPAALPFAAPAAVEGGSGAMLRAAPSGAWWLPYAGTQTDEIVPLHGRWLITEIRLAPVGGAGTVPDPASGDGLEVISGGRVWPGTGDGTSASVAWDGCLPVLAGGTVIRPGRGVTDAAVWDVAAGPAELRWQDADGKSVTWKLPAASTGPLPSGVREVMDTGSGC